MENTMERTNADTLPTWQTPTVEEVRVSAEVTAYAAIWAD
jgi:coenzyme PQQ precursor peptide PqqA